MLFLAIHSEPRSRKDEVFWFQKLDVKNSILFVRNVVGACIYLGLEQVTVFFGFTGVFWNAMSIFWYFSDSQKLKYWILWSIIQSGWAIGLSKQSGALPKLLCFPKMYGLWGFHRCLHVQNLNRKWSAAWKTVKITSQSEAKSVITVKSQIFVRYLISYFRTFEKSAKFNTGWKFIFVLRPSNFNVILCRAPRKYEN